MSGNSQLANFLVGPGVDQDEANQYIESLKQAPLESIEMILRTLMQNIDMFEMQGRLLDELLQLLQSNLLRQSRDEAQRLDPDLIMALYDNLPDHQQSRFILLHCLAIARTADHLHPLCEALVLDPPATWIQSGLVLSPLFQHDDWDVDVVFPRALDAIQHSSIAGIVLDLANHLFRGKHVDSHPCTSRNAELIQLLSGLVARLEQAEKDPTLAGDTPEEINKSRWRGRRVDSVDLRFTRPHWR